MVTAAEGLVKRWSTLVLKVIGQMPSDAFKARLAFSHTVINLA